MKFEEYDEISKLKEKYNFEIYRYTDSNSKLIFTKALAYIDIFENDSKLYLEEKHKNDKYIYEVFGVIKKYSKEIYNWSLTLREIRWR